MNPVALLYSIVINFIALALYMLLWVMHGLFWYVMPVAAVALLLLLIGRGVIWLRRRLTTPVGRGRQVNR